MTPDTSILSDADLARLVLLAMADASAPVSFDDEGDESNENDEGDEDNEANEGDEGDEAGND